MFALCTASVDAHRVFGSFPPTSFSNSLYAPSVLLHSVFPYPRKTFLFLYQPEHLRIIQRLQGIMKTLRDPFCQKMLSTSDQADYTRSSHKNSPKRRSTQLFKQPQNHIASLRKELAMFSQHSTQSRCKRTSRTHYHHQNIDLAGSVSSSCNPNLLCPALRVLSTLPSTSSSMMSVISAMGPPSMFRYL